MENVPVIKFDNFTFQYNAQQSPTLYGINLEVRKGEKILIAGPSGCGKSTLAHCINGLIPFSYSGESEGSLKICGKETKELSLFDISKSVGTVLQDSDGQFVGLTVAEDIAFALENNCVEDAEMKDTVLRTAETVGIESHLLHSPTDLSGGQKQRVSIAGVITGDVDILLFDEPLANLDPASGKKAIELIDDIQKKTGAAVIIIEHRLEDALWRSVDRVVLMNDGRIISDTSPDELLSSSLLIENGVREPLYISALKYAGIEIRPGMRPSHIDSLILTDNETEAVRRWFSEVPASPAPVKGEAVLSASSLEFTYANGCKAIDGISAEIYRGEMLAVVGTNGAGKTTFSKLICGFEKPQSGTLLFCGEDMSDLSIKERADRIGYVMQNPNQMISKVMIKDEVCLGLQCRGADEAEQEERCERVLKVCGLWPFRNWPISALSYGQKKRVTIASILALNPDVIILDEPTAGQDYRHYTEIMSFLSDINRMGITVIMITHDMHLMLEYADRALVFSDGRIIADDSCYGILTDPEIIERASLKETSLYSLAVKCGIDDAREFVRRFIDYEREVRSSHD